MRHSWFAMGLLAASSLLAGCDGGGDASTVTPDEARSAVDATKKWQESHSKPQTTSAGPSSAADIARKKQLPR
jgi:hypothetical protein